MEAIFGKKNRVQYEIKFLTLQSIVNFPRGSPAATIKKLVYCYLYFGLLSNVILTTLSA